jgi:uncharacterized protein YdeI (YjbR/CyaY-like superfamily)
MLALMVDGPSDVIVADASAWRVWLERHHGDRKEVWLVLARKGTVEPTRLTYAQALEEALCYGWIDGQVRRRDDLTYRQRFTPRRGRSAWTEGNAALVRRLTAEGRMHEAGLAAVERARADGGWQTSS